MHLIDTTDNQSHSRAEFPDEYDEANFQRQREWPLDDEMSPLAFRSRVSTPVMSKAA